MPGQGTRRECNWRIGRIGHLLRSVASGKWQRFGPKIDLQSQPRQPSRQHTFARSSQRLRWLRSRRGGAVDLRGEISFEPTLRMGLFSWNTRGAMAIPLVR